MKFNNDNNKAIKYFGKFAELIGRLRIKKFDSQTGEWIIGQDGYEAFERLDYDLFERPVAPMLSLNGITKKNISGYENVGENLKLPLYDYQKQVVKFAVDSENSLIVLPCGSGKTPIGLAAYLEALKENKIQGCGLIVVKASLKTQWLMEIKKFTNLHAKIIQTYASFKGVETETEFYKQFDSVDLMILNYETLRDEKVRAVLHRIKPQFIMADEVHYVKNVKTARAKALYEFADAKIKIGATATPVQRDPRDIFGIFKFIHPDLFPSIQSFNYNYVKFVSRGIVGGAKNEEQLNKKISSYMIVKGKEEISKQLPKLVVIQRYCDLEPLQVEMTKKIKFEIDELQRKRRQMELGLTPQELSFNEEYKKLSVEIFARQSFAQELADSEELLKMSDSETAKKYITGSNNNKLDLLMDLIEEIVESGEKITIFSRYAKMQEVITNRIKFLSKRNDTFKFEIAKVSGDMNEKKRYEEVYTKFQENDEYKVLLMSDAGAEGFNLSKCKYLCEYEPAISYAIQTQRHGRIERANSSFDNVIVYQLMANNSWDEISQKIVSKKERYDVAIIKNS